MTRRLVQACYQAATAVALIAPASAMAQSAAAPPAEPTDAVSSASTLGQPGATAATNSKGLDEIVVTARKRSEDVQSVPLSVSAIGGEALERRGIVNVRELATVVPSLALIGQNTNRGAILQIRGIGSGGLNPGIEPDVGVYFDGVYQKQAGAALSSSLLDLEAIEVLRGPQGTLYGRNTPVGAVIVRSRAPTDRFEAMVQGGIGNRGLRYLQGYIGGGIAPDLAARVSVYGSKYDGGAYNLATNSRVNGTDQYGVRFRARWTPSDSFASDIIFYYNHVRANCCIPDNVDPTGPRGIATPAYIAATQAVTGRPYVNLTARDRILDSIEDPLETVKTFGASMTNEFELGSGLSLNSITAYSGTRIVAPRNGTQGQPIQAVRNGNRYPIDDYSQEFRLSNDAKSTVSFQLGAYLFGESLDYLEERVTITPNRVFPDGTTLPRGITDSFRFHQNTFSASGYGQATWNITDALRVTGGGRYSRDRKRGSAANVTAPATFANFNASFPPYNAPRLRFRESKVTWLGGLQYDVAPTVMVYGTASTGWKSGGFNGRIASGTVPLVFNAENARNYELGMKSTFLERRLLINLSLYKLQVKGFQDSTLNPVTGSGFIVGNAGDIHSKGIEADIQARPIPQLLINLTGAYLSAEYQNYSAAPCYTGAVANGTRPATCNLNGRTPAFSPKFRGSIGGEFTQPISGAMNFFLRGDVGRSTSQYTYALLDPISLQKAFTVVNARFGLEEPDGRWRASIFARNLTDTFYYTSQTPVSNGGFLSAGGRTGVTSNIGFGNEPRSYGLELSYRF